MVARIANRSYLSSPEYQRQQLSKSPSLRNNISLRQSRDFEAIEPEFVATATKYPYLRSVLAPEYAALPTEQLEALMESQYGQGAVEQYDEYFEGFLSDVGKFAAKAAPVVTNIAGGVVKGATTGASLGLPGIIAGAVAGGVGQGFASYGSGTLRDIGKGINTGIGVAGQFTGTGRIGSSLGGALSDIGQGKNVLKSTLGAASNLAGSALGGSALGGGTLGKIAGLAGGQGGVGSAISGLQGNGQGGSAASQLLSLIQRPEVLQSLGAMAMGPTGRTTIPVGSAQTPIPTSAFTNLLGLLANRAADEQAALSDGSENDLRYLMDDAGEWVVDPTESEQRANHLYDLLNAAEYERMVQADQKQQQLLQQQMRQQAASQERMQQARVWQRQQEHETAMYDAVDLSETYALVEDIGEYDEYDEGSLDEGGFDNYGEYDEYDEYNEYDEYDEYAVV